MTLFISTRRIQRLSSAKRWIWASFFVGDVALAFAFPPLSEFVIPDEDHEDDDRPDRTESHSQSIRGFK